MEKYGKIQVLCTLRRAAHACHNFLHLCEKNSPQPDLVRRTLGALAPPRGQRAVAYAAPQADSAMALGLTSKIIKILIGVCRCSSRNTTHIR